MQSRLPRPGPSGPCGDRSVPSLPNGIWADGYCRYSAPCILASYKVGIPGELSVNENERTKTGPPEAICSTPYRLWYTMASMAIRSYQKLARCRISMCISGTLEVFDPRPAFLIQDRMDLIRDEAVTVALVSNKRHAPLYVELPWNTKPAILAWLSFVRNRSPAEDQTRTVPSVPSARVYRAQKLPNLREPCKSWKIALKICKSPEKINIILELGQKQGIGGW